MYLSTEMLKGGWRLRLPTTVEFGTGCLRKLPDYLIGTDRVLLVTGRHSMKATGVTDRICTILKRADIACEVFDGISAEPNYDEVDSAGELARSTSAQAVIGCGGGSAMDAAKAVAVAATHEGPIMSYTGAGGERITARTLPVIAVSSTSGTGSHVGRVSVVSDRSQRIKRPVFSDYLYPRAAFCDPEVLRSMPPEITAVSGFDAFAQALEGYLSSREDPMGNICAAEAMRIIFRALPQAVKQGDDLALRAEMAWGDTLAGIALATNLVVTPHALSMVIGGRYGVAHGAAIAAIMVACLRYSRKHAIQKLSAVAKLLGFEGGGNDEAAADAAIEAIEQLISTIGLKKCLGDYGVPRQDFESIAEEALAVFGTRIEADPAPADARQLAGILQQAWTG